MSNRLAKTLRKSKRMRKKMTPGATWRLRQKDPLRKAILQERPPFPLACRPKQVMILTRQASGRRYSLDPGPEGRGRTA